MPTHAAHSGGDTRSAVDLYWLPLGAGGCVVRLNGRLYEAYEAWNERRPALSLYHCALEAHLAGQRYAIELTPVGPGDGADRGVVREGPVGSHWLGRWRPFRYEVRCWPDGIIPDIAEAVASPQRLTDDPQAVRCLLERAASVPTLVWGRDHLRTGEMWNSNSVISWLIATAGLDVGLVRLPPGGRAPGWGAGLVLAREQQRTAANCRGSAALGVCPELPARRGERPCGG